MVTRYQNPQGLLRRYPAVDANERAVLVAWVRALRPGTLVALLADRQVEPKLLQMRANEPELKADGRLIDLALCATTMLGVSAIVIAAWS